ncbi:hypothetical protein LVO79_18710 (plasmid) [Roseivivax marinus]|uniref:hypothetical protein n=1 Tax=Roseivivax marinus TaxID=1379903 RepID=UPI0004ACBCBE|nr:hypothetical protein [Roseivivax marinus]UMA67051.1 hypothetical protein LVO79_18710 [Roseivivax marinus]
MTQFEVILSVTCGTVSIALSYYVLRLSKVTDQDDPRDPEKVREFVKNAPYERPRDILDD